MTLLTMPHFTPTEQRMLKILSDGFPHHKSELQVCLPDNLGDITNIRAHLSFLRKKLRPKGEDILCELCRGEAYYRWVRILASPYDGRT